MKKIIKDFANEISQITWISGRQLITDTGYVLAFTAVLLLFFTLVDGTLGETFKNLIANR